jgi:hypothetical protein
VTIWFPIFALTVTAARRRSPRPRRRYAAPATFLSILAVGYSQYERADSDSLSAARAEAIRSGATASGVRSRATARSAISLDRLVPCSSP